MHCAMRCLCAVSVLAFSWLAWPEGLVAAAGDWPTFRHDVARSGVTEESLAWPLTAAWQFQARHAPQPAWGDPKPVPIEEILELRRAHFDDVFQVAAAGGAVYFGSSASHKVYCLDAGSGRVRWTFLTGGPVRLAPMVAGGRLYFSSDDGYAYCLDAADGSVVWRFHAAPEDRRVLGQGKMISLWPSRTGVLVDGGVAYFAAGVFPAERVFLYAVDAATGQLKWKNDATGELPQSRVSPQGYMLASATMLYTPLARVSPAAFDRRDGRLLYQTSFGKNVGGAYALLAGGQVFTGTEQMVGFNQETRDVFAGFPGRRMVVTERHYYLATENELLAMDRQTRATVWKTPSRCWFELILAGHTLIAGGTDQVLAVDAASGSIQWSEAVEGEAKGLAVAGGRLLVSTDRGRIYSFGPQGTPAAGVIQEPADAAAFSASPLDEMFRQAATTILQTSDVRRGHCLVWGCETGSLAYHLAQQAEGLLVCAVTPDEAKAAAVRRALDAAGVYGARVSVDVCPLDEIPYADYFANLIVSETAMLTGRLPGDPEKVARMAKPLGGTILLGQPAAPPAGVTAVDEAAVRSWLTQPSLAAGQFVSRDGVWIKWVRGPLPGAGNWTHQYGNLGNTACSEDQLVKAPLGVLWFGQPGPGSMLNRHVRGSGPVVLEDRMFVPGESVVLAYDIYNGVKIWERDLPGAARPNASHDGSSLAVSPKGLFVAAGNQCQRLDRDTGEIRQTYPGLPPAAGNFQRWGLVAAEGERLYGTRASGAGLSNALFALDVDSGERRWSFEATPIFHNTIAFGDRQIFLVAGDVTAEQRQEVLAQRRAEIAQLPESERQAAEGLLAKAVIRRVVCLDRESGAVVWQKPLDMTNCSENPAAMFREGVLVLFGVYLDGHYWQQFFAGQFAQRRVIALNGDSGSVLWSAPIGYRVRPLIIGDTLHAEPWAFDLHNGRPRTRVHPVTGVEERWQFARPGHHCGAPSAAQHTMFFRSWNLGYYDLEGDAGVMHFGGQRPGCWINFLPVGGLAVMPEASTGCMCDFPNHGTVVFQPVSRQKAWAYYSAPGPTTPVKDLALNFGALGDRRDSAGTLWLAYPRPQGSLVLALKGQEVFYGGGSFRQDESVYAETAGTADPWLFASAARGLRKLALPLIDPGEGTATYRVRLWFADAENTASGQRVFDIRLQDQVVAADYDILAAAGGPKKAVMVEFSNVQVDDWLTIELVAKISTVSPAGLPLLNGVEVQRQRFTQPGCTPPAFVVNRIEPEKAGEIQLVNRCDETFSGRLTLGAVPGIEPSWQEQPVQLISGQRLTVPLSVKALVAEGVYDLPLRLARADGTPALERMVRVEHLGTRARAVLKAVADAHVQQRYAGRNAGTVGVLLVDGGNQTLGDADHAVALLRFSLDLPGKPVRAKLRLTNAGNATGDAGRICLVDSPWEELKVTYQTRPKLGAELAKIGPMAENQVVERELAGDIPQQGEFHVAIDPTSLDGVDFLSRESGRPAELIVEYELQP